MKKFELDEEHLMLRDMVRDMAAKEVAPHAAQWDREAYFPRELYSKLGELGLMGIMIPEQYGGSGMDLLALEIAVEEMAFVDGSAAITLASHNSLCLGHLLESGTEAQKHKYLPKLASGEHLGAWGLTEPGSGSDAAALRTRATKVDGGYLLNGSKTFITQGYYGDIAVILAATSPEKKQHGISAFILERGMPGFTAPRKLEKLGLHASDTAELRFDNVFVPEENLLGEIDHGFIDTLKVLDKGRVTIGALALGMGRGALAAALKYAQERSQFGGPIVRFEALQQMLAEDMAHLDAAKFMLYEACTLHKQGVRFTRQSAQAKLYASEVATKACEHAIQIHGGAGYTTDFPVERFWRNAKLCEIGEGTSEILRLVIARQLLRQK